MYLKELTLRGFKSFASTTKFRFEPGITAIVGPNGSGKSNVVDALAWVMGEQGAKSLRGGNMADVIFAGGTSRGALGRAQVELTIDNSDGRLPISYSEVTISRTMFRSGGSEYAINRQPVRLLDVQELLSDSGLGRQMHVIVGQGQLDRVLSASPADRRAFIDEAAGVAKHRRRKERALRKLESMDANLVRVLDLTEDMSQRLRPLARQAKAARAAHGVRSSLAYASARVLADDLSRAQERLSRDRAGLEQLRAQTASNERKIQAAKEASEALFTAQAQARTLADEVGERYRDFTEQRGRFASIEELANERAAGAARTPVAISESSVDLAQTRAEEAQEEAEAAQQKADSAQQDYLKAAQERAEAEPQLQAAQNALAQRQNDLRMQKERYDKSLRDLESARLSLDSTVGQAKSAQERLAAALKRQEDADCLVLSHLQKNDLVREDERQSAESSQYEAVAEAERASRDALAEAQRLERTHVEEYSRLRSKRETLESSLAAQSGANEKTAMPDLLSLAGMEGTVEDHLKIDRGWEEAVNALLGSMLSAVVVQGEANYRSASNALAAASTASEIGAGGLVMAAESAQGFEGRDFQSGTEGSEGEAADRDEIEGPAEELQGAELERAGLVPALRVVHASPALHVALSALLQDCYVCADTFEASEALGQTDLGVGTARTLVATKAGAVLGRGFTRLRGVPDSSRLVLRADLEETTRAEAEAKHTLEEATKRVQESADRLKEASKRRNEALSKLRESDAQRAQLAQETARLKALAHAAVVDVERIQAQVSQAQQRVEEARQNVVRYQSLVPTEEPARDEEALEEYTLEVDRLRALVQTTWEAENQARLEAHIAKEAATSAARNAHAFLTQAQSIRADRAAQLERESRARHAVTGYHRTAAMARAAIERATGAAQSALALRDQCRLELQRLTEETQRVSEDVRSLEEKRSGTSEELLQMEVAFASQAATVSSLQDKALELTAEYGSLLDLRLPTPPGLREYQEQDSGERVIQEEIWDETQEAGENLVAAYGPHLPWEPPSNKNETPPNTEKPAEASGGRDSESSESSESTSPSTPYVREVAQDQMASAQRALARLGVVNPLAIEEYEAASARYNFLQDQVQDLNRSKADLMDLIRQVDAQVKQAFEEAFADTAEKFESTFERLFPGGTGRLELTDPEDPLTTGVEIYARPLGKRVTRLSLLSGGERSLAALAYLIAIFEARPSPFYILDEIEAALDDLNLSRVLSLLEDLRKESQLLIITHQKRTMEFADALYGVTMKDGVTAVMSHRMAG